MRVGMGLGINEYRRQRSAVAPSALTIFGAATKSWQDSSDAASITSSGGFVSQWSDKSGNGNHAVQATGAYQPQTGLRTLGGNNALYFDGANDHLTIPGMAAIGNGDNAAIVVFKAEAAGAMGSLLNGLTSDDYIIYLNNTNHRAQHRTGTALPFAGEATLGVSDANPHIILFRRSAASYGLRLDGGAQAVNNGGAENVTTTSINIGSQSSSFRMFNGIICETVLLTADPTLAQFNAFGALMNTKWTTPWTTAT